MRFDVIESDWIDMLMLTMCCLLACFVLGSFNNISYMTLCIHKTDNVLCHMLFLIELKASTGLHFFMLFDEMRFLFMFIENVYKRINYEMLKRELVINYSLLWKHINLNGKSGKRKEHSYYIVKRAGCRDNFNKDTEKNNIKKLY